jgi:hypothetical protein
MNGQKKKIRCKLKDLIVYDDTCKGLKKLVGILM